MAIVGVLKDKISHSNAQTQRQNNNNFVTINGDLITTDGVIIQSHTVGQTVHNNQSVRAGKQNYIKINGNLICVYGDNTNCGANFIPNKQNFVNIQ